MQTSENEMSPELAQQIISQMTKHSAASESDDDNNAAAVSGPDLDTLWAEYDKKLQRQKEYEREGVDMFPDPGIVLKVKIMQSEQDQQCVAGRKLFINMCMSDMIVEPSIENIDDQERLRVPLSCGAIRLDHDKEGKECHVVDVVVNPGVLERIRKDADYRSTICEFAVQNIELKFKLTIARGFKFPKMRYKGGQRPLVQRVRKSAAAIRPLIEEMAQDADADAPMKARVQDAKAPQSDSTLDQLTTVADRADKENSSANRSHATKLVQKLTQPPPTDASKHHEIKEATKADQPDAFASSKPANNSTASNILELADDIEVEQDSKADDTPPLDIISPPYSVHVVFQQAVTDGSSDTQEMRQEADEYLASEHAADLPDCLIIDISLPHASSAADVDIAISDRDLVLKGLGEPPISQYYTHMEFPFQVNDDSIRAKFNKKRQRLRLMLDVIGFSVSSNIDLSAALELNSSVLSELCE
jgi:PIH1 N-terminal domain/PIH1 CS-like domain